jgi:TadE-like protein
MRVSNAQRRHRSVRNQGCPEDPRARSERGAELVEFAIVVTLLLVLVFGIIGFGLTLYSDVGLNNAVREGARNAVVANYSCGGTCTGATPANGVADFVKNDTGLKKQSLAVMVQFPATYAVGQEVLVCAMYPMTDISGLLSPFLGGRYIKSETKMRLEQAPGTMPATYQDPAPNGQSWSFCS